MYELILYLTINPSILTSYPESGLRGSNLSRELHTSLSPDTFSRSSGGDPKAFLGKLKDIDLPACLGSFPGAPPSGTSPKHLPR